MLISKSFKTLGIVLILFVIALLFERNNPNRLAFSSIPIQQKISYSAKKTVPTRLTIKNLKIDLPIYPAKIKNQQWQTTTVGVSWLTVSPIPGEQGNSILYGHNWENLLGNLTSIKPDNKIEILYSDGSKKTFSVINTAIVSPKNVSVLLKSKDRRITIYTCTGFFDERRFVVAALLL